MSVCVYIRNVGTIGSAVSGLAPDGLRIRTQTARQSEVKTGLLYQSRGTKSQGNLTVKRKAGVGRFANRSSKSRQRS